MIWELLAKRLAGEIEPKEEEVLNSLLKEKKEDLDYMINVMENFNSSLQDAPESPDIQQAVRHYKKAVMAAIEKEKEQDIQATKMKASIKNKKIWVWAAAILLLLVGGWSFLYFHHKASISINVVTTERGNKTKMLLPDGTEVWLNAETKLSYPNNFKEADHREVTLSGEAYFKVKHDANHPFIIHTRYLNITDLGTAFNVRAYPNEEKNEATLIKGSISVSLKADPDKNLLLKPGEKITYFTANNQLKKEQKPKQPSVPVKLKTIRKPQRLEVTHIEPVIVNVGDTVVSETAWLNNQLIFNNENFSELAQRMSRYYNVNIIIRNEAVEKYSFTGIFEGESLEEALKELQMIRPFSFKINKNSVIINK